VSHPGCETGFYQTQARSDTFEHTSITGFNIAICVSCTLDRVGGRTLIIPLKVSNFQTEQFDLGGGGRSLDQLVSSTQLAVAASAESPQFSAGSKVGLADAQVFEMYSSSYPYFGSCYSYYEL
jgi:hypothetical protein